MMRTIAFVSVNKIEKELMCSIPDYYMTVSHKDWELPNSRI